MLILLRWLHRWYEALVVAVALILEAMVFISTTLIVGRPRPSVPHLDGSPVGSSFPSGHVAAAVCYATIAIVVGRNGARRWVVVTLWTIAVASPIIVGLSRMYRGMHFMSDVVAGMILGVVSVVVTLLILTPAERARRARALPSVQHVRTPNLVPCLPVPLVLFLEDLMTYLAVIANTKKLEPGDRKQLNAAIEDAPFAKVDWLMIQKGSAAKQAAAKAVDNGADIVLVCGGDGSVRAAAEALVGTDTALAVMPAGTANQFAHAMSIPEDMTEMLSLLTARADAHDRHRSLQRDDVPRDGRYRLRCGADRRRRRRQGTARHASPTSAPAPRRCVSASRSPSRSRSTTRRCSTAMRHACSSPTSER